MYNHKDIHYINFHDWDVVSAIMTHCTLGSQREL